MRIILLAADSMGVRSMATLVRTKDTAILIDPSAALSPRRFGLRPHRLELEALELAWQTISEAAEDVEAIIVTHYHYDHHSRKRNTEIYKGKILFAKNPKEMINDSQRWRARAFLRRIEGLPEEIIFADSKEFFIGDTLIRFSQPVPHGERGTRLGYVIEVLIRDSRSSFLFTSDIEGAAEQEQLSFILENRPSIVYLDGPPIYLPNKISPVVLSKSIENIRRIIHEAHVNKLIIAPPLLRDLKFREYLKGVDNYLTAAEYMGRPLNMLEARRRELWEAER